MEGLASTSFDRYARYSYTYRVRFELLEPGPLRILDVGDPYGTLDAIFADDATISIDLFSEGPPAHDRHQHVVGSGFQLPFPDGSFDLVTAHDVLEHVPNQGRLDFLLELMRVSSGPVVVAAPFADPRTRACEDIVNSFYVAHVGHSLEPLDEHAAHGLPDLDGLVAGLREHAVAHLVYSDGWLYHWLTFMLLKAHYVSLGASALDRATDAAFNRTLRATDARPPHYRRALILRPPPNAVAVLGEPMPVRPASSDTERAELEQLASELIQALPWREDPSLPGSTLRRWIELAGDRSDAVRTVASSLESVLDDARSALRGAPPAVLTERNNVTAVVVDRGADASARAVDALRAMEGIDCVMLCRSNEDDIAVPDDVVVVAVPGGDDALQIAIAAERASTGAILIVDPEIEIRREEVDQLIAALRPDRRCVGFHRPTHRTSPVSRGLRTEVDGSALYVARELFLVDRDLYRLVGGLDGRFGGQLDDVDFGWRLNLYGYKVTTVGPARWGAPAGLRMAADIAVLWCWIKNLELPTLAQVLARELLVFLSRPVEAVEARAVFEHFEHLLEARAEIARRRIVDDRSLAGRFGELVLAELPPGTGCPPASVIREVLPRLERPATPPRAVILVADDASRVRTAVLARLLAAEVDVIFAGDVALPDVGALLTVSSGYPSDVEKLAGHSDVLIMPAHLVSEHQQLLRHWDGVLVVDLADAPATLGEGVALERGDLFLCASPQQQDHWLPKLRDRGRGTRSSDPADELLRILPTSAVDSTRSAEPQTCPFEVVVDVQGLPSGDAFIEQAVEALRSWGSKNDVHVELLGAAVREPASSASRAAALVRAAVVVRPTPDVPEARLASPSFGLDPLALGVPLITTRAEPAAWAVEERGAGAVVSVDPGELVRLVAEATAQPATIGSWRARAIGGGAVLHTALSEAALLDVVRRPWRWRYAHAGGLIPLAAMPAVRELLERAEAAVTASVTEALNREHEKVAAESGAAAQAAIAKLTKQLTDTECALNEARDQFERIRMHPLVRIASAARRMLRSG